MTHMKKIVYLSALLLIFFTLNIDAKKRSNHKFIFGVTMSYDRTRGDSLVPLDSIKHIIATQQINYLFLPCHALVGLHFNDQVYRKENNMFFAVPLDGGHGCIQDTDGIQELLTYISELNCSGKANIQVRGFDLSSTNGTYFAFTCHTPQYDPTTIPDSLELYHDAQMYESHERATQIAIRTLALMNKNKRQMKSILKEEYEIWEKYLNKLARLTPDYQEKMTNKERSELLLQDFLWMDKRHPGNKIVICSQTLKERIYDKSHRD